MINTAKILKLSKELRDKGYHKYADELEYKFLVLKKTSAELYSVFKETGESLLDDAHPEGSVNMSDAKDEGGVVETLVDQKKKIEKVVSKDPTGKLSFKKIVNFIKNADEPWAMQMQLKYPKFYKEYDLIRNNFQSIVRDNEDVLFYDVWKNVNKKVGDLSLDVSAWWILASDLAPESAGLEESILKMYGTVYDLVNFNSDRAKLLSISFPENQIDNTIRTFEKFKQLRPSVEKLYRSLNIIKSLIQKETKSPLDYDYTQATPETILTMHKSKIQPLSIYVSNAANAINKSEAPEAESLKKYFNDFSSCFKSFNDKIASTPQIDNKNYFKLLNDSFATFAPEIKPVILDYVSKDKSWNTIPNLFNDLKSFITSKLQIALKSKFNLSDDIKKVINDIFDKIGTLG